MAPGLANRVLVGALVLGGLLASPLPARADRVTYTVQLDAPETTVGVPFELKLTIVVEGNVSLEDFTYPDVAPLRVLSTERSENSTVHLGVGSPLMRRTITITRELVADLPGRVRIGRARASAGRMSTESDPLTVTVLPAGSPPRPPSRSPPPAPASPPPLPPDPDPPPRDDDPPPARSLPASNAMIRSGLFATLEADKTVAFMGDQVTLTIKLYSRLDLSDIEGLRLPRLEGFWSEEVENPRRITPTAVMVEGQRFQSYLLRRVAVFPTRAGEFDLAPVEADVLTGGSFFSPGRRQRAASLPLRLVVQPLPAEGQPPAFPVGNVGQFSVDARLDRTRMTLAQVVTLTITVTGTGNLRQLAVPTLPPTPDLRAYDPAPSEDIQVRNGLFTGSKSLEYLLQPKHPGRVDLPTVVLHYFDPKRGQYLSVNAPRLLLTVSQDAAGADGLSPPGPNLLSAQARLVRPEVSLRQPWPNLVHSPALPVMVGWPLGLALSCLAGGGWWRRRRQRLGADQGVAAREALGELKRAARTRAVPGEVHAALTAYLVARLGSAVPALTRGELRALLLSQGVAPAACDWLVKLLDDLDEARYAPGGSARAETLAGEAVEALKALEKGLEGRS